MNETILLEWESGNVEEDCIRFVRFKPQDDIKQAVIHLTWDAWKDAGRPLALEIRVRKG